MAKKQTSELEKQRDQFTMILEDIRSQMGVMVEMYQSHNDKFASIDKRFNSIDQSIEELKTNYFSLKEGQNHILEYAERIESELHGELRTKVSVKEFTSVVTLLEKRITKLEKALAEK